MQRRRIRNARIASARRLARVFLCLALVLTGSHAAWYHAAHGATHIHSATPDQLHDHAPSDAFEVDLSVHDHGPNEPHTPDCDPGETVCHHHCSHGISPLKTAIVLPPRRSTAVTMACHALPAGIAICPPRRPPKMTL